MSKIPSLNDSPSIRFVKFTKIVFSVFHYHIPIVAVQYFEERFCDHTSPSQGHNVFVMPQLCVYLHDVTSMLIQVVMTKIRLLEVINLLV